MNFDTFSDTFDSVRGSALTLLHCKRPESPSPSVSASSCNSEQTHVSKCYSKCFVGNWQSHPFHDEKLSILIYPNGQVHISGSVPKKTRNPLHKLQKDKAILDMENAYIIQEYSFRNGSLCCNASSRYSEISLVLSDKNLVINGIYHLYKDEDIINMNQEIRRLSKSRDEVCENNICKTRALMKMPLTETSIKSFNDSCCSCPASLEDSGLERFVNDPIWQDLDSSAEWSDLLQSIASEQHNLFVSQQ
jgi:hypothetical protein